MAVYVDDAKNPYGRMLMSHMAADSLEELHEMADMVGLQRKWFQDSLLPHYDLCQSKKRIAIHHGAIKVSTKELIAIIKQAEIEKEQK
jgi:signal recognition particle subunit SEC65